MSKLYSVSRVIHELIKDPKSKDIAADLLLEAIDMDLDEFEFEFNETPKQYLFGKEHK